MTYVLFAGICLLWGTSFLLMKLATPVFGPLTIGAGRLVGGAVALGVLLAWQRGRRRTAGRPRGAWWRASDWPVWAGMIAMGFVFTFVAQPYLIARLNHSGFIGMMVAFVPLFTLGWAWWMLHQVPSVRQVVGVLLGLAAMPLLVGVGLDLGLAWWELALAVSVPLSYAWSNTLVKSRMTHVPAGVLTAVCCGVAAGLLLPVGLACEPIRWPDPATGWTAVGALMVLGVLATGVATLMFYRLIQERGPLFAGMVTYIIPVEAVLWGALDNEPVAGRQVVALVGVLAAVALVQWPARGASAVTGAPGSTTAAGARRG